MLPAEVPNIDKHFVCDYISKRLVLMKLQLDYPFNCTPAKFWEMYFDQEFTKKLHTQALGSTSIEIISQSGDVKKGLKRTLRYGQSPDMPSPVKKLFGSQVITTEEGSFDPATGVWSFSLTPGTLANKTQMRGTIKLEEADDSCVQKFSLVARVKILGVGSIVEGFIERQARETQDRAALFMNEKISSDD